MDILGLGSDSDSYDSDEYSDDPGLAAPAATSSAPVRSKVYRSDIGVRYWLSLPSASATRGPAAIVLALHGTAREWCMGLVDEEGRENVDGCMAALAQWGPEAALRRHRAKEGGDDACGALLEAECIVITPLAPLFPWPTAALRNLVIQVAEEWNANDRSRVYVVGSSFGGHAAWTLTIEDARRANRCTKGGASSAAATAAAAAVSSSGAVALRDPFGAERDVRIKEGRLGGGQVMTMNDEGKLVPLNAPEAASASIGTMVMPFLFLGTHVEAADAAALEANGVVMCLDAGLPSDFAESPLPAAAVAEVEDAALRRIVLDLPHDNDGALEEETEAKIERIVATFRSSFAVIQEVRQRRSASSSSAPAAAADAEADAGAAAAAAEAGEEDDDDAPSIDTVAPPAAVPASLNKNNNASVLIHCADAVSASAAIAAAFMMQWRGWNVARSAEHLLGRCEQAHPSPLYTRALFRLHESLPHVLRGHAAASLPRGDDHATTRATTTPFFAATAIADGWVDPEERWNLGSLESIARARRPMWLTHSAGCVAVAPTVAIETVAELRAAYGALDGEEAQECGDDVLRHCETAVSSNAIDGDESSGGEGTPFLEDVETYRWLLLDRGRR